MVKIMHDSDADASVLNGKTVAVIGYGSQGSAQALCMRDSGVNVIIGSRPGPSAERAVADGFQVMSFDEAAEKADIVHILLPDESGGGKVGRKRYVQSRGSGKGWQDMRALSCGR